MNFAPEFISCIDAGNENGIPDFYPANSTLSHVADHVTYIGDLIGYDHVGLGSDFDGISSTPRGLEDVSKFPDLIAELLERGVSDADAAKIVGANSKRRSCNIFVPSTPGVMGGVVIDHIFLNLVLRVWKDVEGVAARLQANGEPILEDDLPSLRIEGFHDEL